ncbi:hypothetical protein GQ600_25635 [Phytophthora cactorum]|nr:hypothetical protein GQ600_25635 [Phytophthora cactorum]
MLTLYDASIQTRDGPLESPQDVAAKKTLSNITTMPERIVNIGAVVFIFLNFNARGILSVFERIRDAAFRQRDAGSDAYELVIPTTGSGGVFRVECGVPHYDSSCRGGVLEAAGRPASRNADGLLGSAASVSRIILPLLPAAIPTLAPVFWIDILLCTLSILLLWWYSRLVYKTKLQMLE